MMTDVEHFLPAQNELGEGPLWHPDEQALYWVNIAPGVNAVLCWRAASGQIERFDFDLPVTALGIRTAGGLVVATRDGFAFWQPPGNSLDFIADPEADILDARFNDGAVDPQGRFWAGTMMPQRETSSLYRLDPAGAVARMDTGMIVSNGIGWSPDRRTMYFTDSFQQTIFAYDFDSVTGEIGNRRPFVHTPDKAGVPDGLTVDSEGFVWSARCRGGKIVRYDPNGRVAREVGLPVSCPTSCAFGGPNLDELFITSSWLLVNESARAAEPLAGDIFRLRPGVVGMEEFCFPG